MFGSVAIDFACDYTPHGESLRSEKHNISSAASPQMYTSNIAAVSTSLGGVGHNVALAVHRAGSLPTSVRLCSMIADDLSGQAVLKTMESEGLDTSEIVKLSIHNDQTTTTNRTAHYVATNDAKKDLVLAMADMQIFASSKYLDYLPTVQHPPNLKWVVVDANWSEDIVKKIMLAYSSKGVKVAFEPVSVAKSGVIFQGTSPAGTSIFPSNMVDLATPNHYELAAMHATAKKHELFESDRWWQVIDSLGILSSGARDQFVALTNKKLTDEGIPLRTIQLLPIIPTILTKLGSDGVLLTELLKPDDYRLTDPSSAPYILSRCRNGSTEVGGVYMRLFPPAEKVKDIVSVNGVGDTFLGVLIAGLARGLKLDERLINLAQRGAVMTLRSPESVSPQLSSLRSELDFIHSSRIGIYQSPIN